MPDLHDDVSVGFHPLDADTTTLQVSSSFQSVPQQRERYFLVTDNAGATFTRHPVDAPPIQAYLATRGRYWLRCPGTSGFEQSNPHDLPCANLSLHDVENGPLTTQPPGLNGIASAYGDAQGRIWAKVFDTDARVSRLFLSTDNAATWRDLTPPEPNIYVFGLSPDRQEVWMASNTKLFRLTGDKWQVELDDPDLVPDDLAAWVALGDGAVVLAQNNHASILTNGSLRPTPGMNILRPSVALDGTIVLAQGDRPLNPQADPPRWEIESYLLGIGKGSHRRWIKIVL